MKKYLAILLSFLLLTACISASAFADFSEGKLYYTVDNASVTITGCFGHDSEITVPASIAGNPVNTIAAGAFVGHADLKIVNLPDTIMTVEEGAFDAGITVNYNSNLSEDAQEEIGGNTEPEVTPTPAPVQSSAPTQAPTSETPKNSVSVIEVQDDAIEDETEPDETSESEPTAAPVLIEEKPTSEEQPQEQEKDAVYPLIIAAAAIVAAVAVIVTILKKRNK